MIERINSSGVSNYQAERTIQSGSSEHGKTNANVIAKASENRDLYESGIKSDFSVNYDGQTYTSNAKLVEHLKVEQEENQARFLRTVKSTILKQATEISGDGIWKFIASGDYTVDAETKKAAEAAIAEDGYWGVQQTSQRIVAFAKALVGGDASRLEEMKEAFIKGYKAAGAAWGGELPGIAGQTYDAVMKLFDEWEQEGAGGSEA